MSECNAAMAQSSALLSASTLATNTVQKDAAVTAQYEVLTERLPWRSTVVKV